MKDSQKQQDFINKTIFSYVKEMYSDDDFLITMIKKYEDIYQKTQPLNEMAKRVKELIDKTEKVSAPVKSINNNAYKQVYYLDENGNTSGKIIHSKNLNSYNELCNSMENETKLPTFDVFNEWFKNTELEEVEKVKEKINNSKLPDGIKELFNNNLTDK